MGETDTQGLVLGGYRFNCRFETDAELPYYKGSAIRGVFGRALKKVVCALKTQMCESCLLRGKCLYAKVFETRQAVESNDRRIAAPPHPFVIEPPDTTQTGFSAGDAFSFSILLMGEVNDSVSYIIYAFDRAGKAGIGRRIEGKRGMFAIEQVECGKETIYRSSTCEIKNQKENLERLLVETPPTGKDEKIRLSVELKTPLRLKFGNRFQADLPFHILARAMLRRISSLMNAWGDGEPDLDYKGLVKRAKSVEVVENRLAWADWRRYSFRQQTEMRLGGMVGSVVYEGRLGEYLPFIDFCQKVHLGKQTSFGLGKIKAEAIP